MEQGNRLDSTPVSAAQAVRDDAHEPTLDAAVAALLTRPDPTPGPADDQELLRLGVEFDAAHERWRDAIEANREPSARAAAFLAAAGARGTLTMTDHTAAEDLPGVRDAERAEDETFSVVVELALQALRMPAHSVEGLAVQARSLIPNIWATGSYEEEAALGDDEDIDKEAVRLMISSCCAAAGVDWKGTPLDAERAAIPALLTTPSTNTSVAAPDPILAAIAETRCLCAAWTAALNLPQPAKSIAPHPEVEVAAKAFHAHVGDVLLKTVPTTAAGCAALARQAVEFSKTEGFALDEDEASDQNVRILDLIARSPLAALVVPSASDFATACVDQVKRLEWWDKNPGALTEKQGDEEMDRWGAVFRRAIDDPSVSLRDFAGKAYLMLADLDRFMPEDDEHYQTDDYRLMRVIMREAIAMGGLVYPDLAPYPNQDEHVTERVERKAPPAPDVAYDSSPDPILALIERHRQAYAEWRPYMEVTTELAGNTPEYAHALEAERGPREREEAAYSLVLTARPTTLSGLAAWASYLPKAVIANCVDDPDAEGVQALASMCDAVLSLVPAVAPEFGEDHPDAALTSLASRLWTSRAALDQADKDLSAGRITEEKQASAYANTRDLMDELTATEATTWLGMACKCLVLGVCVGWEAPVDASDDERSWEAAIGRQFTTLVESSSRPLKQDAGVSLPETEA